MRAVEKSLAETALECECHARCVQDRVAAEVGLGGMRRDPVDHDLESQAAVVCADRPQAGRLADDDAVDPLYPRGQRLRAAHHELLVHDAREDHGGVVAALVDKAAQGAQHRGHGRLGVAGATAPEAPVVDPDRAGLGRHRDGVQVRFEHIGAIHRAGKHAEDVGPGGVDRLELGRQAEAVQDVAHPLDQRCLSVASVELGIDREDLDEVVRQSDRIARHLTSPPGPGRRSRRSPW